MTSPAPSSGDAEDSFVYVHTAGVNSNASDSEETENNAGPNSVASAVNGVRCVPLQPQRARVVARVLAS
jgi:hypothetical protein